jgi:hypothetical protein
MEVVQFEFYTIYVTEKKRRNLSEEGEMGGACGAHGGGEGCIQHFGWEA